MDPTQPQQEIITKRCDNKCELCDSKDSLHLLEVPSLDKNNPEHLAMLCEVCTQQVSGQNELDINHWHCLNGAIWSPIPAILVLAYRLLQKLKNSESWAQDLLDQIYLEDELKALAHEAESDQNSVQQFDSNGTLLSTGDSVSIIKDLAVKGTSFIAKRGTTVKNIRLTDNPEHIEGRVNGTSIVLKTCFLKKT